MYKINVKSEGKYRNVVLGERYVFSKRNAKRIIALFLEDECEIEVTKFIKCGGCWVWSDDHDLYGGIWVESKNVPLLKILQEILKNLEMTLDKLKEK